MFCFHNGRLGMCRFPPSSVGTRWTEGLRYASSIGRCLFLFLFYARLSSEKLFNVRDCDTNSKNVETSVSELTWGCEGATQRKAGERDRKHLPDKPLGYLGCLHAQLTPGLISCGSFREAPFTGGSVENSGTCIFSSSFHRRTRIGCFAYCLGANSKTICEI